MICTILSVGDELILGQTVDTNSAWLSRQLAGLGAAVTAHMLVADDSAAIQQAIKTLARGCDCIVITGGIGPTVDDMTRQALTAVMGVPLELNEGWLARLEDFWRRRGAAMPAMNRIQAMIPRGARLLDNPMGTAAGIGCEVSAEGGRKCEVFSLPGVPKEMMRMFEDHVRPVVAKAGGGAVILSRALHTFGIGESVVAERLGDLMARDRNPSVGTTVSGGIVTLRINVRAASRQVAAEMIAETEAACRGRVGDLIFGADDQTLGGVVAELIAGAGAGFSVTTAESCTGGLLAKMLTDIAGSSAYFRRGWVTYANDAKMELLGVPRDVLDQQGAVSEGVALAMARGAMERAEASVALSITGIAGPSGGSAEKPVGTVWIGLAARGGGTVWARRFLFSGDREMIRDRAAKMALALLRYHLLGQAVPF